MYIVHCGTGTLWFGRSLKSSCPPDSWELMENLEQTISSHSRFWRFWSQSSVLMEPSSEREEAVCGRGAWQGACLPHSRLCPQVGDLTWFSGLLLYPAVHYRLRAIRGGPFGVVNFASHTISVQIFQMEISALPHILSVSKYSRYISGGWNEQ